MQFRIIEGKHTKTIQFIRSEYDRSQTPKPRLVKAKAPDGSEVEVEVPGVRRSKQTLVGSMDYYATSPTEKETSKLTENEIAELTSYLSALRDKQKADSQKFKVSIIAERINESADIILSGESVTDLYASEIWAAMSKMSKALRKAGHPKPAPAKPADTPAPEDSGQGSLELPAVGEA